MRCIPIKNLNTCGKYILVCKSDYFGQVYEEVEFSYRYQNKPINEEWYYVFESGLGELIFAEFTYGDEWSLRYVQE